MTKKVFALTGATALMLSAAPMAMAQDGPLVPEDQATHVAYIGAAETPTGTAHFRLNPQAYSIAWTINFDVANVTGASIACPTESADIGIDAGLNLVDPVNYPSPIEGDIAGLDPDTFDMISTGQCSVSILTAEGVRYNGVIESAE